MFSPFQRVWSNTGSTASRANGRDQSEADLVATEATGQVSDANLLHNGLDLTTPPLIPPWMRDLQPSGSTRHSRASSVVSTRTEYSMMTLQDDARSIDIHVGGQTFRIARDGSRISDAPPPPYTAPAEMATIRDGRPRASSQSSANMRDSRLTEPGHMSFRGGRPSGPPTFDHYFGTVENEQAEEGAETPRQHSRASSPQPRIQANILDPSEVELPSPVDGESQRPSVGDNSSETPSRNWSYKAGPDVITIAPEARKLRSVSQNDLPLLSGHASSPLVRRNGVRLPVLITESLNETDGPESVIGRAKATRSPPTIRSAGPVLYTKHDDTPPQSPSYIGRHARGIFPACPTRQGPGTRSPIPELSATTHNPDHASDGSDETALPLPMDSENDISLHYARLMRTLDRDHRKALHLKDKELEKFRERLNEMDVVYRQELKFRDFVIDDLKKKLDNIQEASELGVEKARNEVEDLWESRWRTQSNKLTERLKEAQKTIERLTVERRMETGS
jgi:hypothetical protein